MKSKRWKRRNRHKNTGLYNAYLHIEKWHKYPYRHGLYVVYSKLYGNVIRQSGKDWSELPYDWKPVKRNA